MFDFILVAQALGIINQYFEQEVLGEDFWELPCNMRHNLDKDTSWFMINPQKLKAQYRISSEALIVTEEEKSSLLKAFILLSDYSKSLPENAQLAEKLLLAKKYLPPVFFESKNSKTARIIPFSDEDRYQALGELVEEAQKLKMGYE